MKRLRWVAPLVLFGLLAVVIRSVPAQAQTGSAWQVSYFNNPDWSGAPVATTFSNALNFNWGSSAPAPGMPAANWTATMVNTAYFYSGVYRFTVQADDEIVLTIDSVTYLDTRNRGQSGKVLVMEVPLSEGNHSVVVHFRQFTGGAFAFLTWEFVKQQGNPTPTPPPPPPSGPPSAQSVQTQYGDYTPCIQQNLHQAECFQSDGAWNSPNMGSIQMEPKIEIWGNCTPDSTTTFVINGQPRDYKCSKTAAGWFPT